MTDKDTHTPFRRSRERSRGRSSVSCCAGAPEPPCAGAAPPAGRAPPSPPHADPRSRGYSPDSPAHRSDPQPFV